MAELASIALRWNRITDAGRAAELAALILVIYNAGTLAALRGLPTLRLPVIWLLAGDVLTVGALVGLTGGLISPFSGLFFLATLLSAIYYDVRGSLATAVAAVALLLVASYRVPGFWQDVLRGETRTQLIPFLLLHGGVAGYLVSRLKQLHERRIQADAQLRAACHAEQLRQHEAEIAREIQIAALASPPKHPCYEAAVTFLPAREVGGDLYSFVTDGDRMGVVIGDVSGKGIPAALVATTLCHLVECLDPLANPPGFLAAVNNDLVKLLPDETFATLQFVVLDPGVGEGAVYNAGHHPPLVASAEGCRTITGGGPALGIIPDLAFDPEAFHFGPGDRLLLYTDGVIEVRNAAGEMLSIEGLASRASRLSHLSPPEMAEALIYHVSAHGPAADDLTLVVVRAK